MGNTSKRNFNLDLLKILSCVAVVGLHCFGLNLNEENRILYLILYYACGFAVGSFMLASGYILLNRGKVSSKEYTIRKIGNIIKIVLFWGLIGYLLNCLILISFKKPIFNKYGIFTPFIDVAKDLLQRGLMGHFWYFGALIILYSLLPFFTKITMNKRNKYIIWIIFVLISIVIQFISYYLGYSLQSKVIQTFRLWTWIQYFFMGGILKDIKEKFNEKLQPVRRLLVLAAFIALYIFWQYKASSLIKIKYAEYFYDDIVTICFILFFSLFVLTIRIKEKYNSRIEKITSLTLGVYIIHPIFLVLFTYIFGKSNGILIFVLILMCSFFSIFCLKKMKLFARFLTV